MGTISISRYLYRARAASDHRCHFLIEMVKAAISFPTIYMLQLLLLLLLLLICQLPSNVLADRSPLFSHGNHLVASGHRQLGLESKFRQLAKLSGGIDTVDEAGGTKSQEDEDGEDDEEDREDESEDEDEDEEEEGKEKSWVVKSKPNFITSVLQDVVSKIPPLTRIFIASSLLCTLASFILNDNNWPEFLDFNLGSVLRLQLWRLYTAFLYFGPCGINYFLTIQFIWSYMSQIERLFCKKPEDFLVLCLFGFAALIPTFIAVGFPTRYLGHSLGSYFVYIWAKLFESSEVSIMNILTINANLVPWFFCLQTLLIDGVIPYFDLFGIAVGHLYLYLLKQRVLIVPKAIKALFQTNYLKREYSRFRTDFEL